MPMMNASISTWYNAERGEGNCWSDYTERYPGAEDADHDGIWNTPCDIPPEWNNNQDMFPFVKPDGWKKRLQTKNMSGHVEPDGVFPVPP